MALDKSSIQARTPGTCRIEPHAYSIHVQEVWKNQST